VGAAHPAGTFQHTKLYGAPGTTDSVFGYMQFSHKQTRFYGGVSEVGRMSDGRGMSAEEIVDRWVFVDCVLEPVRFEFLSRFEPVAG
jgi:hypothetical protein